MTLLSHKITCVFSSSFQSVSFPRLSAVSSFPPSCLSRSCRASSPQGIRATAHPRCQRDLRTEDRISADGRGPPAPSRICHSGKEALQRALAFRIPYRSFPGSQFRRNRSSLPRDAASHTADRIFRCSPLRRSRSSFRQSVPPGTRRPPAHSRFPRSRPGHLRSAYSARRPSDRAAPR